MTSDLTNHCLHGKEIDFDFWLMLWLRKMSSAAEHTFFIQEKIM